MSRAVAVIVIGCLVALPELLVFGLMVFGPDPQAARASFMTACVTHATPDECAKAWERK